MPSFVNLPTEIEYMIFQYLADDKKALYYTIRVSRAWYEHTNGLLWQHFSALSLALVEELPQRQDCANKAVKLRRLLFTWNNIITGAALKRLCEQLPSLGYLDVGYNYLELWGTLSGVKIPQLKTFKMDSHQIQHDFIQNWKEIIATDHLSVLLRLAPKLETLCLGRTDMDIQDLRDLKLEYEKRKCSS